LRWSLTELENIVYDFINSSDLPKEFLEPNPGSLNKVLPKDVSKEDLMNVIHLKQGENVGEPLP
jgi:hypothetical protein